MRRKLFRYCFATLIVGVAFTWWFWPRDFLTAELLSQINIGMTSHEVIQILGTPASERYQSTLGHKFTKINIDGIEVPQHYQVVEPKNAWYPKLMVVTPYGSSHFRVGKKHIDTLHKVCKDRGYSLFLLEEKLSR